MNTDSQRSPESKPDAVFGSKSDAVSGSAEAIEAGSVPGVTSVAADLPATLAATAGKSTTDLASSATDLASVAVQAAADNSGSSPKSANAASIAKLAASPTSPAFLAINTVSMALLGLGIILIVGACFSSTPWLPLQPMVVASAYLTLTSLGLLALLLMQAVSANYVHGNKRATAIWGMITLVLVVIAALVFAVYRPTLEGTIALGAPRAFWLVFGGLLLVLGGIVYRPASHLGKQGTNSVAGMASSVKDASAGMNASASAGQVDARVTSAQHFSERRWLYFGTFLVLAVWTIYRMAVNVFEWYDMLAAFGALIALSMFLWGTLHHLWER